MKGERKKGGTEGVSNEAEGKERKKGGQDLLTSTTQAITAPHRYLAEQPLPPKRTPSSFFLAGMELCVAGGDFKENSGHQDRVGRVGWGKGGTTEWRISSGASP